MKFKAIWVLLLSLSLPFGRGVASAQTGMFYDEFGNGFKAAAMGQAFTAVADDSSAAYYNPAGLTQTKGIFELTAGYMYGKPRLRADYPETPSLNLSDQRSSHGLYLGIASNLDFRDTIRVFPWFRRFAFAMTLWANLPEFGQYHSGPTAIRPHFLRHDMGFQALAISISLGIEITRWLSVGGGIIPAVTSSADEDVFQAVNKMNDDDPVRGLRLSIHQTATAFVVPVCGILIRPPFAGIEDKLAVGVSFRGENKQNHGKGIIRQDIGMEDEYGEPLPVALPYPDHYNINLVSYIPWQLTAGISGKPVKGLTLAYDMTFKRYSEYLTYLELTPAPPFRDTYTHRFGVEYAFDPHFSSGFARKIRRIAFRGGYYFEPTPVPEFEPLPPPPNNNIYDSDQDVFSAGLALTLGGEKSEHEFEFSFQYHHFRHLSRYAYFDAVYAFMNGLEEPGYQRVDIGGYVWGVGGSYTLRF